MSSWPEGISLDEVQKLVEEHYEDFWDWLLIEAKDPPYIPDDVGLDEWLIIKRREYFETPGALKHYRHLRGSMRNE